MLYEVLFSLNLWPLYPASLVSISSSGKYQGGKEVGSDPYIPPSSEYIFIIFIFFPTPRGGTNNNDKTKQSKTTTKNQNKPPKPTKKNPKQTTKTQTLKLNTSVDRPNLKSQTKAGGK